jgi:hypothetical protein
LIVIWLEMLVVCLFLALAIVAVTAEESGKVTEESGKLATTVSIFNDVYEISDLKLDENNRLKDHWLLVNLKDECKVTVEKVWKEMKFVHRSLGAVDSKVIKQILGDADGAFACTAVCLEKGTHYDFIHKPVLDTLVSFDEEEEGREAVTKLTNWAQTNCQSAEIGFISYHKNPATIFWLNSETGEKVPSGHLHYGERNTVWQQSFLGHKFEVVDSVSNKVLGTFEVKHHSFHVIGDPGSGVRNMNVTEQVRGTLHHEWERASKVKRTFTELGFSKSRMPDDLWSSISSYYYNNRHAKVREEWDSKGVFVNWWESDVYMIGIPWNLKKFWQKKLSTLIQIWSGVEVELTDIYGMRRYEDGARLLAHVDREATHAVSLIINVAQGGMRQPWNIEILDLANRLHTMPMDEGDIVYYESAKCLHARMEPLRGAYYVNLFAHYRPTGDPKWFTKDNTEKTPLPLIDLGNRTVEEALPYYSGKSWEGPEDVFNFWKSHGGVDPTLNKNKIAPPADASADSTQAHEEL